MFDISHHIFLLLLIMTYVSGACVSVGNEEMVEYACDNGHMNDLLSIPAAVEKIRISNMNLPIVTRHTFSRFAENLLILMCTHCGIETIEPDSFIALTSLQQLRLDNNHLTTVRAQWFDSLKQLTYLDLNYNAIETIEDGVFDNLPELVDLRISGNKLQCLNVDELARLESLKRIFVAKNSELKCPNALSRVLEQKQIDFEKDPEWELLPQDLIQPVRTPVRPTTPAYKERLTLTRSPELHITSTTSSNYLTSALYPNYDRTTEVTRGSSVPWHTASTSYPSRNWPTPTEATPDVPQTRTSYNDPYYSSQQPRYTTQDSNLNTNDRRYPIGPTRSSISWTGDTDLNFSEGDVPPIQPLVPSSDTSKFQTPNSASPDLQKIGDERPAPPLQNYEQIEEREPVTKNLPNPSAEGPKSSSAYCAVSIGLVAFITFYSITQTV